MDVGADDDGVYGQLSQVQADVAHIAAIPTCLFLDVEQKVIAMDRLGDVCEDLGSASI